MEKHLIRSIRFYFLLLFTFISIQATSADPPPETIAGLSLTKSGDDVVLSWTTASKDIYGNPLTIDHYNIYCDTYPEFIPDFETGINRIGQPITNSYTDTDALLSENSYYYYVTASSTDGTESLLPSNIGYKIRLPFTYDPNKSNKHWLSLPYNTAYSTASDLGSDAPNITQVIRWKPATQSEELWDQTSGTGINFSIIPGEAYAIVISNDTVLNLVGSYSETTLNMTYNTDNFNINWFSMTYPNAYGSASQMAQDIHNTTKVGRYDSQNNTYDSWFRMDGSWMGEDFSLIPGEGYLTVITANMTWNPSTGHPEVTVSANATDGLSPLTVNLSGTVEDKNGSIYEYTWDHEGDGIFDDFSPDTSKTYTTAGTYYPTLLVFDNDLFRGYDFQTVEIYSLENQISVEDFNPSVEETVDFNYTISNDGLMTILIYDKDHNLIRALETDLPVTAGQHTASWDGKNDSEEIFPDGAYYVVFEYEIGGKPYSYTYDLRLTTGGEDITSQISVFDISDILSPLAGQYIEINYTPPKKALVTIEIKDQSDTVIRHLLTDIPRTTGSHQEIWDGANDSGQILQPGTTFYFTITGTSLSDNAIITKGFAPTLTDISASPIRFSPATNPYGTQDKSSVIINFALNKTADVSILVFNESENLVRTITETGLSSGKNQVAWNGRNDSGILLSDGKYAVQLRAQDNNGTYSNTFIVQTEIFY